MNDMDHLNLSTRCAMPNKCLAQFCVFLLIKNFIFAHVNSCPFMWYYLCVPFALFSFEFFIGSTSIHSFLMKLPWLHFGWVLKVTSYYEWTFLEILHQIRQIGYLFIFLGLCWCNHRRTEDSAVFVENSAVQDSRVSWVFFEPHKITGEEGKQPLNHYKPE